MNRAGLLTMIGAAASAALPLPARAQSAPPPVPALTPVRVGMALTDGITPVLYAIQTGLFKAAGLDVTLTMGNNGAALAAAVIGGSVDIAASSLMPLLTAHTRGVPLRIIAGSTIFNPAAPTGEACVLKGSRVQSFADLTGLTVAMTTVRSLDQLGIMALVDKAGGNSSTVKFIETPGHLLVEALDRGAADVISLSMPTLEVALETGELRVLGAPGSGVNPHGLMIAAFMATPTYVAANRSVVDRFTRTLYHATAYTNAHHAETVDMLAAYTHMDADLIRRMTRETIATSTDIDSIQPAIDLAAKYKFIDGAFNARELLA